MKLLAIDPSSSCSGYAVMSDREQFILDWCREHGTVTSWDREIQDAFGDRFGGARLTRGERIQRIMGRLAKRGLLLAETRGQRVSYSVKEDA